MRCPKCQFDHPLQTTECLKCGIVFSRYKAALAMNEPSQLAAVPLSPLELLQERADAVRELKYRIVALPVALLLADLIAHTGLRLVSGMLAMVLHESGHAITAWLTGRWAVPSFWVTMHGDTRSWPFVLCLSAAIVFAGHLAWKAERWGWVATASTALVLQMTFLALPPESSIVFGGDAGALVLASLLMAAFYAPRESALRRNWGLRWGLLVIGALSFMHVFLLWRGPYENLPFGEIEGVNLSDPSLLTEMYGWSVTQLVDRYIRLGTLCLLALLAIYLWGLLSAYVELRSYQSPETLRSLASR